MTSLSASLTQESIARRESLVRVIRFLHTRGWTPATSSNFSCRDGEAAFSVSVSGLDKGELTAQDFIGVDFSGQVLDSARRHLKPSAETLLHAAIYDLYPDARFVLHTHSINGTVLSKLYDKQGGIMLRDFEILKGFEGVRTHEAEIRLPILPNAQDMPPLARSVRNALAGLSPAYGFLLAGHGLYTWGETAEQAKRHAEVFEFLFEAILKLRTYGYPDYTG